MSKPEICVLVLFVGFPIVLCFIISIIGIVQEIKMKMYEKKYPQVFELIKERDKTMTESCDFHNHEILPLKQRVDRILNEQKYFTDEKLAASKIELNQLCIEIAKNELIREEYLDKEDKLLEEIETLIKQDKKFLKFMKGYGWCKD